MKVSLHTIGCKVNFAETSQLREKFESLGYEITDFGSPSDIILLNTCTVTNKADADARKLIRRSKRKNPGAFIGVMGCYAQLRPEEISGIDGVSAIFGQKEKAHVPNLIHSMVGGEKTQMEVSCTDNIPFDFATTYENESRTRGFMKLQDGCDYFCSFCTIPRARGSSRSMPFDKIPGQLDKIANNGYNEVVISGINLGTYEAPTGENFTDVVKLINSTSHDIRVRISSIEPNLLNDEIIHTVLGSKVFCPHFHIPLQSGSDEILRKMKRRYKSGYYTGLINKIKSMNEDCGIGVDVIVGFPGETEEHFGETYNLLDNLPVSYFHVFTYSEREGTKAAEMKNKVPERIRKERTNLLRDLSERKKAIFYKSQEGKIKTVIPETFNKDDNTFEGWTENYVRVKFPSGRKLENVPVKVKLIKTEGNYLKSEIL